MYINELVRLSNERAIEKGWWEGKERTPLEVLMLMVTELAESAEEFRNDKPPVYFGTKIDESYVPTSGADGFYENPDNHKPDGWAVEMVDCLIRMADYFGHRDINMEAVIKLKMDYNAGRAHRHGGKLY